MKKTDFTGKGIPASKISPFNGKKPYESNKYL